MPRLLNQWYIIAMHPATMLRPQEQGNVLFLILIAVALFAALAYAVALSNSTSGSSISKEKSRTYAAQIVQHGQSLRSAIMKMKMLNGCTDTTLNFTNGTYKKNNGALVGPTNSTAPVDKRCNVYDSAGGNISPIVPPVGALDLTNPDTTNASATSPGSGRVYVFQVKGIGTDDVAGTESANDLVFFSSYINRDTCMAINDLMGIENPGGEPMTGINTGSTGGFANGSFAATAIREYQGALAQPTLCYSAGASGYTFLQVLVER